jgi:spore germination protein
MKTGQIRMIFFSDKLAKKGLMDLINPLLLDPNISGRVYLAIVNGDMIGYLNHQLNNRQEQIELSLYQMFTHYEKQDQLTTVNLHQFMESFYNPYTDPVLPYYSISNHELHYQGTAFFLKDRMVGVIRPPKDVFFSNVA